jgi:hypothetical protein
MLTKRWRQKNKADDANNGRDDFHVVRNFLMATNTQKAIHMGTTWKSSLPGFLASLIRVYLCPSAVKRLRAEMIKP